jgi:hypothetical protein
MSDFSFVKSQAENRSRLRLASRSELRRGRRPPLPPLQLTPRTPSPLASMQVAHRIGKLFTGEALKSAGNAVHRRLHPIDVEDVFRKVDLAGLNKSENATVYRERRRTGQNTWMPNVGFP